MIKVQGYRANDCKFAVQGNDCKFSTGALDLNMETNVLEPQILGTVRKGVSKRKLNADEKLDKICTLLETVISTR